MGKRKFSDLQIEFVKNNYPEFGAKYCAEKLGLSNEQVRRMANHRNITLLPQTKEEILLSRCPDNDRNVPTQQFINVKTPEVSYILGILWAECWLNKLQYGISFSILEDDYNDIDYLINDVGQWNKYYRQRVGRRPSVTVSMYSKVLYNFFWELGMYPHSVESASKLINIVPNKFKHIWWAGYFDGDGSIYASQKQLTFTGPLNQDWEFFDDLCTYINIKYYYQRIKSVKSGHCYSRCRITNIKDIQTFGKFIYQDGCVGMQRKFLDFNYICGLYNFKLVSSNGEVFKVLNLKKWAESNGKDIKKLYVSLRFGKEVDGWRIYRIGK